MNARPCDTWLDLPPPDCALSAAQPGLGRSSALVPADRCTWLLFGPLLDRVSTAGDRRLPAGNSYSFFVPGLLIQLGLFGAAFVGFSIIADWRFGRDRAAAGHPGQPAARS